MHNKEKSLKEVSKEKTAIKITENPISIQKPLPIWPKGLTISDQVKVTTVIPGDLAIVLSIKAFRQLFGWAYATSREISSLGAIRRDGNEFLVEEFFLLKQGGSFTTTELDETAITEFMEKLLAEGKMDQMSRIKCWAHSHPGMGVFWSGTDDSTCRFLTNDYLISLVVSDEFTILGRIDIAGPIPITLNHVPVLYELPQDSEFKTQCADEVKAAVSERGFDFDDFPLDCRQDKLNSQTSASEAIEIGPELYCGFCGTCHANGDCPLDDCSHVRTMLDDGFTF